MTASRPLSANLAEHGLAPSDIREHLIAAGLIRPAGSLVPRRHTLGEPVLRARLEWEHEVRSADERIR